MTRTFYEVKDNAGNWERIRDGYIGKHGTLCYVLRDGTIGIKDAKNWRQVDVVTIPAPEPAEV